MLKILKYEQLPKEVSKPVLEFTSELKQFCIDLSLTMRYYNGIGISAPQVGVLDRIIVIDVPHIQLGKINYIMINPEIVESTGVQTFEEGCLSFPKEYIQTSRAAIIKVKWLNTSGEVMKEVMSGLAAAVVQHEIDHLDGITMYDREI